MLRQLGIADNELPHGLARLKHNLLLSLPHTPPQESNICTNSDLSGSDGWRPHLWLEELWKCLYDTMVESPTARRGADPYEGNESKLKTFHSMSYLDQIAIVCLASGVRDCQAPDCLQYRGKLERLVPVCHSWPGLRDWVLCIISCSLHTIRDKNSWPRFFGSPLKDKGSEMAKYGLYLCHRTSCGGLLGCLRAHLTACILLTTTPEASEGMRLGLSGTWAQETPEETPHESGSIGGPRPDQTIYTSRMASVSSRRCPRFTPENLTCRRNANLALALHQCLSLTFIRKHLILYK